MNGSVCEYWNGSLDCICVAEQCELRHSETVDQENCYLKQCFFTNTSLSAHILYPMTIAYLLIFITGSFGNIAVCCVIKWKYLSNNTTNRYLFNLAIADLVTLMCGIPFELYSLWHQYPWELGDVLCHLKAWLFETTSYVSVLTIVAFSFERFFAICRIASIEPKSPAYHRTLKLGLVFCWVVAGMLAIPYGYFNRTDFLVPEWPGPARDSPVFQSKACLAFDVTSMKILFHFTAVTFFALPLFLLSLIYIKIFWSLRKNRLELQMRGRMDSQDSFTSKSTVSKTSNVKQTVSTPKPRKFLHLKLDRQESPQHGSADTELLPLTNCSKPPIIIITSDNTKHTMPNKMINNDFYSKKIFFMLVAVIVAFFVCYFPYQLQRLLFCYNLSGKILKALNDFLFPISGVLFFLVCTINPILYSVMSRRWRRAFRSLVCCLVLFKRSQSTPIQKKTSLNRLSQYFLSDLPDSTRNSSSSMGPETSLRCKQLSPLKTPAAGVRTNQNVLISKELLAANGKLSRISH